MNLCILTVCNEPVLDGQASVTLKCGDKIHMECLQMWHSNTNLELRKAQK